MPQALTQAIAGPALPFTQVPFPDHTHKAAVVRAPHLGAFSVMSAGLLMHVRQSKVVRCLETAVPGNWPAV